jgi:glycerol-3-phosphate O-acyltransferase / dihydroxyacetone phosphate acyltransferase
MFHFFKYNLLLLSTVFFKKVHLHGFEKLPKGKPVLFASNHSNSFLDGIILQNYIKRPTYVLVRGDVFETKFGNWFYRSCRLLPIYRKTDGSPRDTLGKNNASFDECYEYFKKGKTILIFPEAISRPEKTLRPIRKGTARMAFDMETRSDFELGLHVVPMGINYTHFKGYNKELMVSMGDPIPIAKYKQDYIDGKAKATNMLTKEITEAIDKEVVVIDNPELYQVADLYLDTKRAAHKVSKRKFTWSRLRLEQERKAAKDFNAIVSENPSFANTLANFGQKLQSNNLDVESLANLKFPFMSLLHNILTLPLAVIGFFMYQFIPIYSTHLGSKLAKQAQFRDSLIYGFSMVFFVVVHLILFIVLVTMLGWIGVAYYCSVYFVKPALFSWKTQNRKIMMWFRLKRVKSRSQAEFDKLIELNKEILAAV